MWVFRKVLIIEWLFDSSHVGVKFCLTGHRQVDSHCTMLLLVYSITHGNHEHVVRCSVTCDGTEVLTGGMVGVAGVGESLDVYKRVRSVLLIASQDNELKHAVRETYLVDAKKVVV